MFPTFITDKTEKKGKYFHISNMRREKKERNGHIFPPIAEFAKCVRHD
jgi:hypothetical protein